MQLGYLISCLLGATVMLVDVAHAAPAVAEEVRTDSGAAIALSQAASHERECVGPERRCVPRPNVAAPAHPFQPGVMAPAGRLALSATVAAMPWRVAPHATPPLSILFRNFRS